MNISLPGRQSKAKRHPRKSDTFKKLLKMGVPVGTVIDVGILTSTYELIESYSHVPQILVEPIVEFEDRIRKIYDKANVDYELVKVAAGDADGETSMRTKSVRDGVDITHAQMAKDKDQPGEYRTVPVCKIDTLVQKRALAKPYLLKIDVDGHELPILHGAETTLQDCSVVCIEATVATIFERAEVIRKCGFQLFDIVDLCYYDDRLSQVDLIFLNHKTIQEYGLQMYKDPFDISKWNAYEPK